MSLFLASIPFFDVLVRREYTRDLKDGHGDYLSGKAFGVQCRRGRMLGFQVAFDGYDQADNAVPSGGAMFILPIRALCSRPCNEADIPDIAPWDCLSDEFSVVTLELIEEMRVHALPLRLPGRYMFSVQYGRSDLADDATQHKQHHVCRLDGGWFACLPNNRLLLDDAALFKPTTDRPDFLPLSHTFSGE